MSANRSPRTIDGKRYTWRSNHLRRVNADSAAAKLRERYPSARVYWNGSMWGVYTHGRKKR